MKINPTPVTAAFAGFFSAITWPWLWSHFGQTTSSGSVELIAGTLLLVALPAHAFVLGFGYRQSGPSALDVNLLKRIGAWVAAAALTALLASAYKP